METEVESLFAEVERAANARHLDVIDRLLSRRPGCRRIEALHEYVSAKIVSHRQKKRERYFDVDDSDVVHSFLHACSKLPVDGNPAKLSHEALKGVAKIKRAQYYTTDCDCGYCKMAVRPSVFSDVSLEALAELHNGL